MIEEGSVHTGHDVGLSRYALHVPLAVFWEAGLVVRGLLGALERVTQSRSAHRHFLLLKEWGTSFLFNVKDALGICGHLTLPQDNIKVHSLEARPLGVHPVDAHEEAIADKRVGLLGEGLVSGRAFNPNGLSKTTDIVDEVTLFSGRIEVEALATRVFNGSAFSSALVVHGAGVGTGHSVDQARCAESARGHVAIHQPAVCASPLNRIKVESIGTSSATEHFMVRTLDPSLTRFSAGYENRSFLSHTAVLGVCRAICRSVAEQSGQDR